MQHVMLWTSIILFVVPVLKSFAKFDAFITNKQKHGDKKVIKKCDKKYYLDKI